MRTYIVRLARMLTSNCVECAAEHEAVKDCLRREWTSLHDGSQLAKPPGAFNRLRQTRYGAMLMNPLDWYIGRSLDVSLISFFVYFSLGHFLTLLKI